MGLLDKIRKQKWPATAAVIVAAGSGTRMEGVDKLMAELDGRPALIHTVAAFQNALCIDEIILVGRKDQLELHSALCQRYELDKVKKIVPGGSSRMASVQNGLKTVSRGMELVAVQDGARPLVTPELIQRTVEKAMHTRAAAPGVPLKDTVKQVDETGKVLDTPDREGLRAVQTPQVFQVSLLKAALKRAAKSGLTCTDDCAAMEAMGVPVYLVEGDEENIKLTTPQDLLLAERILAGRRTP